METLFDRLFGHTEAHGLTVMQMTMRGLAVFFIALLLIRVSGMRSVGRKTAFDTTIIILLGAVLARTVTGESPFLHTVVTCAALAVVKRLLAQASIHRPWLEHLIKGQHRVLVHRGVIDWSAMRRSGLSRRDLDAELRLATHSEDLGTFAQVCVENNGAISVLKQPTHSAHGSRQSPPRP